MKKCCDSCRFYQKGNLGGSGWCRHPERIEAQSDLVLVRSSQLACRKGWDQDSWEAIPRSGSERDQFGNRRELGPVPPVTSAEFTAVFPESRRSDLQPLIEQGADVDRVVDATPSPIRHIPKALLPRPVAPVDGAGESQDEAKGPDKRETILRAREVQRARVTNRLRPSVDPLPSSNGVHAGATAPPPSAPTAKADTPAGPPVVEASVDIATDAPIETVPGMVLDRTDDHPITRSSSFIDVTAAKQRPPRRPYIPDPDERDLSQPTLRLIHGLKTQPIVELPVEREEPAPVLDLDEITDVVVSDDAIDIQVEDDYILPGLQVGDQLSDPSRPQRGRSGRTSARKQRTLAFSLRNRWSEARRGSTVGIENDSPSADPFGHRLSTQIETDDRNDMGWRDEPATVLEPMALFGVLPNLDDLSMTEPTFVASPIVETWQDNEVHGVVGGTLRESDDVWTPAVPDPITTDQDVVVYDGMLGAAMFDASIDAYVLAPDVPRMCQTCSAFRPSDGGEHGWCSNGWAFDNRQFVGGTGVPCASSIGDWWLPSDDYWDDGLLERLGAPTPLYDREIAPRYAPPRQKPAPRRRRR